MFAMKHTNKYVGMGLALLAGSMQNFAQNNKPEVHKIPEPITRLRPYLLNSGITNRNDCTNYLVKVHPLNRFNKTIHILQLTNNLITLSNLYCVPSGFAVFEIQTICNDGELSQTALYEINIVHDKPSAPTIRGVEVNEEEAKALTLEDLRFIRRRANSTIVPPLPPGAAAPPLVHPVVPVLPNATNRPYIPTLRRNQ